MSFTEVVVPPALKDALLALPVPKDGEIIALSLSSAINQIFLRKGALDHIKASSVVAVVTSTGYRSSEELLEHETDRAPQEAKAPIAAWARTLWASGRIVQPRFYGLLPSYPNGNWRWTKPASEIKFFTN